MEAKVKAKIACGVPGCENPAEWMVWYERCGDKNLSLCREHTYRHMENKDTAYPVVRIMAIDAAVGKVSEVWLTSHGFVMDIKMGE